MTNDCSPAIGAKAIAKMVYGSEELNRRVHNDIQQKRLPVVYVGRTPILYPDTWATFRKQEEEKNCANKRTKEAHHANP